MTNEHKYDPDEQLAIAYEEVLQGKRAPESIDDTAFRALAAFKEHRGIQDFRTAKERVWKQLEPILNQKPSFHAPVFRLGLSRIAIAASILIAAAIGIYFQFLQQKTTLIGESFASIEQVELSDGSKATLRPFSRLYLERETPGKMEFKVEGEGYFDVVKNPERIFVVATEDGSITVLGTRFNLSTWGKKTRVFLEEGSIALESNSTGERIQMTPGQVATAVQHSSFDIQRANESEILAWINSMMIFDNKPVSDIFEEIMHHYNIEIKFDTSGGQERLSGQLSLHSVEQSLEYLALALDGTFTPLQNDIYQFRKN